MAGRAAAFSIDDDTDARVVLSPRESVVVVGNFDGVHRGHQMVLHEAVSLAKRDGLLATVLTFDPHPGSVVGTGAPESLTTLERRVELLGREGVDRVYVRRFDESFAAWLPERFARDLVRGLLRAREVLVGDNFRFGASRAGDLPRLVELGKELGFGVRVHALTADAQGAFSSTRARVSVASGDVESAAKVLGRPHAISGVVGRGDQRGRTLGFPTANLEDIAEVLPAHGVYAVVVDALELGGAVALAKGVMNIGVRPTVAGGSRRTVEAHLFDIDRDLYGARLRVHFIARLREERRFSSVDELRAQIATDAAEARARTATIAVRDEGAFG